MGRGKHRKYLPYVFTEQGIAMLSGLLKNNIAIQVSINIINAFVEMQKYISTNLIEQKYITDMVLENHANIKMLQESFKRLENNKKNKFNAINKIEDKSVIENIIRML